MGGTRLRGVLIGSATRRRKVKDTRASGVDGSGLMACDQTAWDELDMVKTEPCGSATSASCNRQSLLRNDMTRYAPTDTVYMRLSGFMDGSSSLCRGMNDLPSGYNVTRHV